MNKDIEKMGKKAKYEMDKENNCICVSEGIMLSTLCCLNSISYVNIVKKNLLPDKTGKQWKSQNLKK